MKGTADFYNKTALEWAASGYSDESLIPALLDFARQFPAGSRFLDLCCGCGYDSRRVHDLGYEVVGIDFSEDSIRIARERNADIPFYVDNILNDYSYVGAVDAIFVIAGLVHIETERLREAFLRMHRVLADDGGCLSPFAKETGSGSNGALQRSMGRNTTATLSRIQKKK